MRPLIKKVPLFNDKYVPVSMTIVGLGRYSPYRYNRYGHPVVSIHKYSDCRKNETTIPEGKFLFSLNKIFEHLSSPICLMKNLVKTEY